MYRASSLFQVQFDELSTVMKEYFANNHTELVSMCDSKKAISEVEYTKSLAAPQSCKQCLAPLLRHCREHRSIT